MSLLLIFVFVVTVLSGMASLEWGQSDNWKKLLSKVAFFICYTFGIALIVQRNDWNIRS